MGMEFAGLWQLEREAREQEGDLRGLQWAERLDPLARAQE